jgi:N utilization substance protein B
MAAKTGVHITRSAARRKALQLMFQSEVTGQTPATIIDEGLYVEELGLPCDYTRHLLDGLAAHREEVDELIASTSENWTLARMPLVDRSILSLAIFEMLYCPDVPASVSINEAVELAKCFGGEDDSPRFVNGVLGKIAEHLGAPLPLAKEDTEGDTHAALLQSAAAPRQEKKAVHG